MRLLHPLPWLGCLALVGCGHAPNVVAPVQPRAPGAKIVAPTRPTTIDAGSLDVADLPRMARLEISEPAADQHSAARFRIRPDATYVFVGVSALEVEIGDGRVFVTNGEQALGSSTGALDAVLPKKPAVWRGPAEAVDGKLRVVCYEGMLDADHLATADRAFEVLATPVIPGVVYAYRAGRAEEGSIRAPHRLVDPRVTPNPCADGTDRVEFVGPAPLWASQSTVDPRDVALVQCSAYGRCAFSHITLPIERGDLSFATLVVGSAPLDPNAVIPVSKIDAYTFELDWSEGGASPLGRVFVATDLAAASKIHPDVPTYYDFDERVDY